MRKKVAKTKVERPAIRSLTKAEFDAIEVAIQQSFNNAVAKAVSEADDLAGRRVQELKFELMETVRSHLAKMEKSTGNAAGFRAARALLEVLEGGR